MKQNCFRFLFVLALAGLLPFQLVQAEKPARQRESKSASAVRTRSKAEPHVYPSLGTIERIDPALDALIAADAKIELLASGFSWSEGPVWVRQGEYLLFSDVPRNVVFKWKEGERTSEYLTPSGYTGTTPRTGEPGSNGLTLDAQGRLVLCQHGDRQVARLEKNRTYTLLARYFQYRRFNSPNDLVFKSNGDLYVTDPPYGLAGGHDDPSKELMFHGVYRVKPDGEVTLMTRYLTFPNGIALSPDESTAYVAVSDPKNAVIMAYDLNFDGTFSNSRVFFDANPLLADRKGLPDGLKVDRLGNLFATGPGGVLVISPKGRHLGTINTGEPTANCAWGNDGSVLYITANDKLCRIKTTTKGKLP
ncbi:MAG: SMP-30/gluconolactonase/LRE family protein [Verrucomicrobiales bacterium]|nr:SMP-30/gluconolactonase/LRE family protein [Verrucomicrobiales bacterium]